MDPQPQQQWQQPASAQPGGAPANASDQSLMLFLSYFGLFALIPYLTQKQNPFVQWHSKQGLTFVGVFIVIWIPLVIIGLIPFVGLINLLLMPAIGIGSFVLWIMALIKAFQGQQWKIPLIGNLSEKW